MILYHYTDPYGAGSILKQEQITPHKQTLLGNRPAIWFTDLKISAEQRRTVKARRAIGVDHEKYAFDRTSAEVEVSIDPRLDAFFLWSVIAFEYPGAYALTDAALGARPDTWWVCFEAVRIDLKGDPE